MAGRGPAPKAPGARRNHHSPQRGEWVDLPPLEKPILPRLPKLAPDGEAWSRSTKRTWNAWRQDPVTAQWSPADVAQAWDTIELHNEMKSSTANEVRLRMDGLGLTPKGKRDLRWRVAADPAPTAARARAPASSSRRARLSVVE